MLLSAVSILVVAQSSSEIPEGLMNNPVEYYHKLRNVWRHSPASFQQYFCETGYETRAIFHSLFSVL